MVSLMLWEVPTLAPTDDDVPELSPWEKLLPHELDELVPWLVLAVAVSDVAEEDVSPELPPTKPSNPPLTPEELPSVWDTPEDEPEDEPEDVVLPPERLDPPVHDVPSLEPRLALWPELTPCVSADD